MVLREQTCGLCRDLDQKLANTEAQVNELRAHLASASGSAKPSPVFRMSGNPLPGPFQQSIMIPRSASASPHGFLGPHTR